MRHHVIPRSGAQPPQNVWDLRHAAARYEKTVTEFCMVIKTGDSEIFTGWSPLP